MFYSVSWALRRTITMRPGVMSLFFLLCSLFFTCRVLGQEDSAKAIRCQNGYKEYHYGIPSFISRAPTMTWVCNTALF